MAHRHGDAEGGFPLKLLVDSKTNKVVFAEAAKDLVDFFFGFMLLPMGTLVSLVGKESAPGSMGKLYQSIRDLDSTYISGGPVTTSPDKVKDELTNPPILSSRLSQGGFRLPWKIATTAPDRETNPFGYLRPMTQGIPFHFNDGFKFASDQGRDKGFVKDVVTYTITDDLSIAPLSTISSLSLITRLKVNDLGALQERIVMVGVEQGMKILEASLRSETVLSDVFLKRGSSPR